MGIKIIKNRERVEEVSYMLDFSIPGSGCGYSFDCDENGAVNLALLPPASFENYEKCLADSSMNRKVSRYVNSYVNPAVGLCYCGKKVELADPLDNDCSCGRCYNMSGQEVQANYGRAECLADGCAWDEDDY